MDPLLPVAEALIEQAELNYDISSGSYICDLCSTGPMTKRSADSHLAGSLHRKNSIRREGRNARVLDLVEWSDASSQLNDRAKKLGCSKWTKAIQNTAFCSLETMRRERVRRGPAFDGTAIWCETPTGIALKSAKDLLSHFEQMERLSLLELSVWKALCVIYFPRPMRNMLEVKEWETMGWKAVKRDHRHDRGINIILSGVVPFLLTKKASARARVPQNASVLL